MHCVWVLLFSFTFILIDILSIHILYVCIYISVYCKLANFRWFN